MLRLAIVCALVCGCHHDKGRVVVTDTTIEILRPIHFADQSVALDADSTKLLDAIASTLVGNPEILLVAVHAYGGGAPPEGRQQLADQRATAMVQYLVAHGVEAQRLQAAGSPEPPVANSEAAFEILKRKE
jgi:outer membrane protein OmpA-like peptidoglycan-associated protein